ncbi:type II secretion system F family protein [Arthrobacter sp. YAF17]|uniref:type II secretion system F family protein n=1 Tax=Arthrobacter sp. YAF17 TaxID=3233077 RepID=UPI003F8F83F0
MTAALVGVLALAVFLAFSRAGAPPHRIRVTLTGARRGVPAGPPAGPGPVSRWRRRKDPAVSMNLLVQQLAALLKGGRAPARLWDELWLLHVAGPAAALSGEPLPRRAAALAPGSVRMLAAARAAAMRGSPVGAAIRSAGAAGAGRTAGTTQDRDAGLWGSERRVWFQLAACFDVAEATGCPLADVLTRFAAQLEAEDDAEGARQTALAGPRATVRLLTWLPFLGLGLGLLLGVDPVEVLLANPWGVAALVAGLALTAAGRFWSARLVRAAEGLQP